MNTVTNGDLNNTAAERIRAEIAIDLAYHRTSLAIPAYEDEVYVWNLPNLVYFPAVPD